MIMEYPPIEAQMIKSSYILIIEQAPWSSDPKTFGPKDSILWPSDHGHWILWPSIRIEQTNKFGRWHPQDDPGDMATLDIKKIQICSYKPKNNVNNNTLNNSSKIRSFPWLCWGLWKRSQKFEEKFVESLLKVCWKSVKALQKFEGKSAAFAWEMYKIVQMGPRKDARQRRGERRQQCLHVVEV